MCAWAGASKWLSQVHGFGSDEWLMCFMNKTTPRAAKGAVMTFLSPSEWHHQRNVYPLIRGSGSIGVTVILFLFFGQIKCHLLLLLQQLREKMFIKLRECTSVLINLHSDACFFDSLRLQIKRAVTFRFFTPVFMRIYVSQAVWVHVISPTNLNFKYAKRKSKARDSSWVAVTVIESSV